MTNIKRGLRNTWRNRARTIVVVLLLGIACTLSLTMWAANDALEAQLSGIEHGVGTLIEVAAPGSGGRMLGFDDPLDEAVLELVQQTPGVQRAFPYVLGTLSTRVAGGGFGGVFDRTRMAEMRTAPRFLLGIEPGDMLVPGGGVAELVAGRELTAGDAGLAVGLVSQDYAELMSIAPGDTVTLGEIEIEVVGIFYSEQVFARRGVFVPLRTAQVFLGLEGELTHVYAFARTIGEVDAVKANLVAQLEYAADVTAQKDAMGGRLEDSLGGLQAGVRSTLYLSFGAAAVVVFFVMLLTVRERASEIGVLKAIGAAKADIVQQFASEAATLGLAGGLAGVLLFIFGGRSIGLSFLTRLVATPAVDTAGSVREFGRMMQWGGAGGAFPGAGAAAGLRVAGLDLMLTWSVAAGVIGAACVLGFFGGVLPAVWAASLKPAEVLRRG